MQMIFVVRNKCHVDFGCANVQNQLGLSIEDLKLSVNLFNSSKYETLERDSACAESLLFIPTVYIALYLVIL